LSNYTKTKADLVQWSRDKVVELRGIGLTYAEIAQQLQVSTSLIGTDVQYLREQAKENIKEYVTQHLPEQYQICLSALDTVLKNAYVIMQKSEDNREKLQALQLLKDTHLVKLELLSNATTIDSALNYIRNKQQEQQKKGRDLNSPSSDDNNNSDDRITAGRQTVF
jgi:1-aminocyclopropane-1-carboxylate deaminase/D-cysteine desulfhydrase-like pyridoxal-dependent ACC family enzyme